MTITEIDQESEWQFPLLSEQDFKNTYEPCNIGYLDYCRMIENNRRIFFKGFNKGYGEGLDDGMNK